MRNIGKGGALKAGVKKPSVIGYLTLIDFSVPLSEIERWVRKKLIRNQKNVYFGSRANYF